jgi:hypothetical protein
VRKTETHVLLSQKTSRRQVSGGKLASFSFSSLISSHLSAACWLVGQPPRRHRPLPKPQSLKILISATPKVPSPLLFSPFLSAASTPLALYTVSILFSLNSQLCWLLFDLLVAEACL